MHVCVFVFDASHVLCIYICMYVRTYVMYICIYACMHVCMYVCMYVCTHVRTYVCMYVCVCGWILIIVHIQMWHSAATEHHERQRQGTLRHDFPDIFRLAA
jgi:hypothetical protein